MIRIETAPIDSPTRLREALQDAIRLELATIPPYLTALLTLTGSSSSVLYARQLIKDIVVEEMLHLNLVCNILNAIGGQPVLNGRGVVPVYPGPLPMALAGGVEVHLKRYGRSVVRDIFMEIEKPEVPIEIPTRESVLGPAPAPRTIGEFYHAIAAEILRQGETLFTGALDRQVALGLFDAGEEIVVTGVKTALDAIDIIVRQGEGTPKSPLDLQGDIAHYYRFQELEKAMKLDRDASSPVDVIFDPAQPITIDEATDVIAMVDDPQLVAIDPADADAARLSADCDQAYTTMLDSLQTGFNGVPDDVQTAYMEMINFRTIARNLLRQRLTLGRGAGLFAGPRFLYVR